MNISLSLYDVFLKFMCVGGWVDMQLRMYAGVFKIKRRVSAFRSPGVGVTGGYEVPEMHAGNQTHVPCKSCKHS